MFDIKNSTNEDYFINHLISKNLNHKLFGKPIVSNFDKNLIIFGMGCFWGVEKLFWGIEGVKMTAVGYSGGKTDLPDYQKVCTGLTGHNEVVLVNFDNNLISLSMLLKLFWECHDPTQGMRQGNDIGTQYRSGIYTFSEEDLVTANKSKALYQERLNKSRFGIITTEIKRASKFYFAEEYHQQYLIKNPNGYCALKGTGIEM